MTEVLLLALLSAMRERKGVKQCRDVVGRMRSALGMGEEVTFPLRPDTDLRHSQDTLAAYCRACRKCDIGKAA